MKTKITISLLVTASFLFITNILQAQWSPGTGYVYPTTTTDKVIIGSSTTPTYPLQVNSSNVIVGNLNSGDSLAIGISHNSITAVGITHGSTRHAVFGTTQIVSDILFVNKVSSTYDYYERMRINRFGRVGIGTPAPDTSALLDVSSTNKGLLIPRIALVSTTDATTITLPATSLLVYNILGGGLSPAGYWYNAGTSGLPNWVQLISTATSGSWLLAGNSISSGDFIGTTNNMDFIVKTNNAERMRVLSTGNVGIGTAAPLGTLSIVSSNTTGATTSSSLNLTANSLTTGKAAYISSTSATSGTLLHLASSGTAGINNQVMMQAISSGTVAASGTIKSYGLDMEVTKTYPSGIGTNVAAYFNATGGTNNYSGIFDQGNVGIGTTSPTAKLHVNDGGVIISNITSNNAFLRFYDSFSNCAIQTTLGDIGIFTTTNERIRVLATSGNVGIGTTSPTVLLQVGSSGDGTVAKANAWNTFSDANFKTNVVTIKDALKKVLSLRGVTYDWIASGEPSIGFIAQEVDTVLSSIVLTDTLTGFKSLDYSKIVPVIVEGIKQLDSINTGLVSKDSINDSKIQALEATDSILNAKLQNQNSIIASLQNQLIASNTTFQNQLNELMTTINSCCNRSMESPTNNQQTKSLTIPEGEIIQTDVELNNAQTTILEQNSPNPFAERTSINYYLPDNTGKAEMLFYNSQGKLIQSVELIQKGKGLLNVYANDLSSGIYTYTLVVDGKIIDSKKMVRSK